MKNIFLVIALISLLSFTAKEDTYNIDKQASSVKWLGKKTTGEHSGEVSLQSGNLKFTGNVPLSGEFVLNMNSITVTDIKETEDNKHLVEHLKDEDFFGTEKFPTATLTIKKFEKIDKFEAVETNYKATADLTIKGVKNEIQFPVKIEASGEVTKASANITIDRTKWNITYKSKNILGSVADKFIYDDIAFSVKLVLQKQK